MEASLGAWQLYLFLIYDGSVFLYCIVKSRKKALLFECEGIPPKPDVYTDFYMIKCS